MLLPSVSFFLSSVFRSRPCNIPGVDYAVLRMLLLLFSSAHLIPLFSRRGGERMRLLFIACMRLCSGELTAASLAATAVLCSALCSCSMLSAPRRVLVRLCTRRLL